MAKNQTYLYDQNFILNPNMIYISIANLISSHLWTLKDDAFSLISVIRIVLV
jgi:hypothetical protein